MTAAQAALAATVEQEVGRLAVQSAAAKPEPIASRMIDAAEQSAQQVERAAEVVEKLAAQVAGSGRELAGMIRKNAADYEKTVASFADFTKQVTIAIQQAANDAETFGKAAE